MEINLEPPYLIIKPFMTEEQFYRLAGEDSDWEFLGGRIVMHSPSSNRHEDLFSFFMTLLRYFVEERGGALVRGSRYPMRLDPLWSPEPDILVVLEERKHLLTAGRLEGPADWVIEIASESDPDLDRSEKLTRYRDAGIREIWLIDPFDRTVLAEVKTDRGYTSRTLSSGRLESTVVPGFWIEVSWLWQEVLPLTPECLRRIIGPAT